ncbi:hypothetical protein E4U30_001293 [Claviceps sp. LM220 group G6]|nr:hypothetical protein E4U30_001293 [Claviceps sp. LM220 group G6]KAG6113699.1 hypothetical protein E4U31_000133 [Claviceps sp. LM219 group G6]
MSTVPSIVGGAGVVPGKAVDVSTYPASREKIVPTRSDDVAVNDDEERASNDEDRVIVTGYDAAQYLLSLRDDFEPALTFRSIVVASALAAFQAVMSQIYSFKPTWVTISGTFIVLIAYWVGKAWAALLPRGDLQEKQWTEKGGQGPLPLRIGLARFINPGPWNLKEHTVCAVTATSASNAAASITVFTAQDLFYNLPPNATTIILSVISIGLFGYGLCGILRPICVWHVESVYWASIPIIKILQGLHWQDVKSSKPLRVFWYSFIGMAVYEVFPAYIFPWLNSISIPCLASMRATGGTAATLTNLFGGSTNNEGLGLFSLSLDWQYITSIQTSLPLKFQVHEAIGFLICFIAMLGIYYTNAWDAKSLPFMSTRLWTAGGKAYPTSEVFLGGVLDKTAFAKYGIPRLSGTFAYAMFMANAAIGALIAHCALFWGGDFVKAYKSARAGRFDDRHHSHMTKHYREVPWWWYILILVFSFILGLVVVVRENVTLPVWAYVVALLVGIVISPLSTLLMARFGDGIDTNNLSKMLAGLMVPERPIGNMYFSAWSYSVISNCVNLCGDLKIGEYPTVKIPPRVMFLTQIYGTVLGGFVNYAVMVSIVDAHRKLLTESDGNAVWSGASIQSYNTNAASWALAKYLYGAGSTYFFIPLGLAIGVGLVAIHRILSHFVPSIRGLALAEINMPQLLQYACYIPYNQSQTCVMLSWTITGLFSQFYLRNYKSRIFRDYMYLVTGAFDGASLFVLFILSFSVFGAGGRTVPFPAWWGNSATGNLDHCPSAE